LFQLRSSDSLGETICQLITCIDELYIQQMLSHLLSDKMEIDLYVLRHGMKNRIIRKIFCTQAITPQSSGWRMMNLQLSQ
jgi:hypothetical protein